MKLVPNGKSIRVTDERIPDLLDLLLTRSRIELFGKWHTFRSATSKIKCYAKYIFEDDK